MTESTQVHTESTKAHTESLVETPAKAPAAKVTVTKTPAVKAARPKAAKDVVEVNVTDSHNERVTKE